MFQKLFLYIMDCYISDRPVNTDLLIVRYRITFFQSEELSKIYLQNIWQIHLQSDRKFLQMPSRLM